MRADKTEIIGIVIILVAAAILGVFVAFMPSRPMTTPEPPLQEPLSSLCARHGLKTVLDENWNLVGCK